MESRFSVFLIISLIGFSLGTEVQPTASDCNDTSDGSNGVPHLQSLLSNITSNTVLTLSPGCHRLTDFTPVINKTNITLMGNSTAEETIITCDSGIGLVFINVSLLQLRHVVILRCHLSDGYLNQTVSDAITLVPDFAVFSVPPNTRIGTFIAYAEDVLLEDVHINDTNGIGLLAVNVLRNFTIDSSMFSGNSPDNRGNSLTGGGLLVFYYNRAGSQQYSHMSVSHSQFLFNSHRSSSTRKLLYSSYSHSQSSYPIGAGGGLSVFLAQREYSVDVNIDSCGFRNNSSPHGGGFFIGIFIGVQNSSVSVTDSLFEMNGIAGTDQFIDGNTIVTSGQGIALITDLSFPLQNNPISPSIGNDIIIKNTTFVENIAVTASAFLLFAHYIFAFPNLKTYSLLFKNCSFYHNKAFYGGAMYLVENKASGVQDGTLVSFNDCIFRENELLILNTGIQSTSVHSPSILEARSLNLTFFGTNIFDQNAGTPIQTSTSIINIYDMMNFTNNTGLYGGGISLASSSFIILHSNSQTTFFKNTAFLYGGAIFYSYINTNFAINTFDCYLYFNFLNLFGKSSNITDLNIKVSFLQNDAPAGTAVYGSTLNTCSWIDQLENNTRIYEQLETKGIFEFYPPINSNTFATASYRFETNESNFSIMPGEQINVHTISYDLFERQTSELIYSNVVDNKLQSQQRSYLDDSVYWFLHDNFIDVPLSVKTMTEPEELVQVPISFFSVTSASQVPINVTVRGCYPGFEFDSTSSSMYKSCRCNVILLSKYSTVKCFPETVQFTVPNNLWLGPATKDDKNLTVHVCLFDYCNSGSKNITSGNFDIQCKEGSNRAGLLCGQCKEGYSVPFGSNDCMDCSNVSILFLLYFILAGFIVMSVLGRIGMTVSHGFLNSIAFYSNIIVPYQPYLIAQYSNTGASILIFIFSAVNLSVGFPICFFDGMTALARTYLNFAFPVYLWILMGLYTYLARFERFRQKWLRENGASVFASVMLLSYISTLQACTFALSVIQIDGAQPSWRWAPDPSVAYFSKEHAPLGVLSIIITLIYIIPAPLILMFPSLTLSTRLGVRFIPVYDAFWAPFRTNFQFWIGLRLFLRVFPFVFANFAPYPLNTLLLGVFTVILLFVHVLVQPFKGKAQNLLDVYLLLIILLLVISSLFIEVQIEYFGLDYNGDFPESVTVGYLVMISSILILAVIPVLLVCCYHVYIKFEPVRKLWKRLKGYILCKCKRSKKEKLSVIASDTTSNSYGLKEEPDIPVLTTANYSVLREPLLESGELSYSPINN